MMVDTKNLVPMTEANQNFSRVVRMVDESGLAVILKNNKPRYIVVDFGEYEQIQTLRALRARQIGQEADRLLEENQEAFRGVGQMMLLTVEEILALQEKVISQTGGSFGLRDRGLLESAVYSADSSFGDVEVYPSPEEKAARLAFCHYREPCLCGWKQAGRYAGDAADPAAEWARFTLHPGRAGGFGPGNRRRKSGLCGDFGLDHQPPGYKKSCRIKAGFFAGRSLGWLAGDIGQASFLFRRNRKTTAHKASSVRSKPNVTVVNHILPVKGSMYWEELTAVTVISRLPSWGSSPSKAGSGKVCSPPGPSSL